MLYQLQYMADRDDSACAQAKSIGYVDVPTIGEDSTRCVGQTSKEAAPTFLLHGTDAESCLEILKGRSPLPSESGAIDEGDVDLQVHRLLLLGFRPEDILWRSGGAIAVHVMACLGTRLTGARRAM